MIEPIPFLGLVELDEPKLKYCSSCITYKPEETGKVVQTANKKIKRFKCADCLARASAQLYSRNQK